MMMLSLLPTFRAMFPNVSKPSCFRAAYLLCIQSCKNLEVNKLHVLVSEDKELETYNQSNYKSLSCKSKMIKVSDSIQRRMCPKIRRYPTAILEKR